MTPYNTDILRSLKWADNKAPIIQSLFQAKADWYQKQHWTYWDNVFANIFDLRTANAFGLVIWCFILGIPLDEFNFDPLTNSWAYGANRENFVAQGWTAAETTFVSGTPNIQDSSGAAIDTSEYTYDATTGEVTFTSALAASHGALYWTGDVQVNESQVLSVRAPRPFGTADGTTLVFDIFSQTKSQAYNETGGNFYGGGTSTVADLSEIRYVCQLRYIALISNGRQQWINKMLAYIFNSGQAWDLTTGKYFYLTDSNEAQRDAVVGTVTLEDWQGVNTLSSKSRTNYVPAGSAVGTGYDWESYFSGLPSITSGILDPSGGSNASRFSMSDVIGKSTSVGLLAHPSPLIPANNSQVCGYLYAKASAAGVSISVGLDDALMHTYEMSTEWQRYDFSGLYNTSGEGRIFQITFDPNLNAAVDPSVTVDMFAAQTEEGSTPGRYIPTNGAGLSFIDYTLNVTEPNYPSITIGGAAPALGSLLRWTGSWRASTISTPYQFAVGDALSYVYFLSDPNQETSDFSYTVSDEKIWVQDWQGNIESTIQYRSNLVKYSTPAQNKNGWGIYNEGFPSLASGAADPTGGTGAMTFSFADVSGSTSKQPGIYVKSYAPLPVFATDTTASIWIKASEQIVFRFGSSNTDATQVTVGTDWQRLAANASYSNASASILALLCYAADNPDVPSTATIEIFASQVTVGSDDVGNYIPTTGYEASWPGYTIDRLMGNVYFPYAPQNGAVLTWEGRWKYGYQSTPQQFGTGNGTTKLFTLTNPPDAVATNDEGYAQYRIGKNMGFSAQFVNLLNDETLGIMPRAAGVRFEIIQES